MSIYSKFATKSWLEERLFWGMSVALAGNQEGTYNLWWELNLSTGKVGDNSGQAQAFWHKDRMAYPVPIY